MYAFTIIFKNIFRHAALAETVIAVEKYSEWLNVFEQLQMIFKFILSLQF